MDKDINTIFDHNIKLLSEIDKIIYYFHTQNYDKALRTATIVIDQISSYIELLLSQAEYFNENEFLVQPEAFMNIMGGLLEAQKSMDFVLLADLYEAQVSPLLLRLQEVIVSKEDISFHEHNYKESILSIEQKDYELAKLLASQPEYLSLMEHGYSVEPTSSGLMTVAVTENNKKYYFHSNNKTLNEAFTLAQSWYLEEKTEYIIYGLGFGYHAKELSELDDNISIEVYESDINMLQLACAFSEFKSIMNNPKIKIIYDPDFSKLVNRIGNINEETEIVIHYPSLRHIKDSILREKLEDYFIQYSSVKNQRRILNSNFNENILHYDQVIDDLKCEFSGKDLYIIAAGPSLDKNYLQLKNVNREKSIILASGTVFRKLIYEGITPDYVIVTDPNPRVYAQIAGLENNQVPMLLLSTAYKDFAKKYQGRKYLICQKDYSNAEEYAKQNKYELYQTGGSVSTTALDIGIHLGCSKIIFLGLDLGFPGNLVHASGTSRINLESTENLIQVPDVHGNLIYTTKVLHVYQRWIEKRITDVENIEFIDATEGGVLVKGMKIKKLSDVI